MELTLWRPFRALSRRSSDVPDLFESFFDAGLFNRRPSELVPALDFAESKDDYTLNIELPGVDKDDVSITLKDGYLVVHGEKKSNQQEESDLCYCSERYYGKFERSVRLPDAIDTQKVSAHFDKGVLKVTLPKTEKAKPKEIKIKAA